MSGRAYLLKPTFTAPAAQPDYPETGKTQTGQKWSDCGVCGISFPDNELQPQRGAKVCSKCFDEEGLQ